MSKIGIFGFYGQNKLKIYIKTKFGPYVAFNNNFVYS